MMTKTLSLIGGAALLAASLTSCASGGADLQYPTQAQMDAADVQWGLKPRQAKGGPRRTVTYDAPSGGGESVAPAPVAESAVPSPSPTPAPLPPPAQEPALDPATINKLR